MAIRACVGWNAIGPISTRRVKRRMAHNGNRANDVFRSIRALVQKAEPRVALLDIGTVVEEVLVLARGERQQHDVAVRTEVAANLPPVLGDRVQLQQVLLNLVMNAIQAMADVHDRKRELIIRCKAQDGVLIAVEDSGTGLDAGVGERIFDSMFTTKSDGMGLGLSISRSIITAHGGRIWASPGASFGAIFQVALPSERSITVQADQDAPAG